NRAPRRQQRLLQDVLGVLNRAEHPVAVHLQFGPVRLGERPERLAVTCPRLLERLVDHVRILAEPGPHDDIDTEPAGNWSRPFLPCAGVPITMTESFMSRTTAAQRWALALSSLASFIVILDLLVVSTALSTIQRSLRGSLSDLEWTINAYTLSFAVLLLPA